MYIVPKDLDSENLSHQYVGMTKRRMCDRFNEHKFSINSKSTNTVGIHFSATNHSRNYFEMVPIAQLLNIPWLRP